MRAVSYERVSTGSQVDTFSLDSQLEINRQLIEMRGWEFAGSYRDEGISARSVDRPDFQRMIHDAQMGAFDVIVVWKLSRFSRSLLDTLLTMRELNRYGVVLTSASEQFDFSTPIGKVLLALLVAFAELFLDILAEEVRRGKRARAEAGFHSSRVPFGYSKDERSGIAVPDDTAAGYELAASLAETGEWSYRQIAEEMNKRGYRPTGRAGPRHSLKLWTADTVRFMLMSRFYLGEVRYKSERFPGLHEPLIDERRWRKVQRTMSGRHHIPAFKQRRNTRFYLLSGVGKCASCGSPLRAEYKRDSYKERVTIYRYYRCSSRFRFVACARPTYRNADEVEAEVAGALTGWAFRPEWSQYVKSTAARLYATGGRKTDRASAERIKLELERLRDLYRFGDVGREEYLSERDRLKVELDRVQIETRETKAADVTGFLTSLGEAWTVATGEEQKRLVRKMVRRVVVSERRVVVEFYPEYAPFFALSSAAD